MATMACYSPLAFLLLCLCSISPIKALNGGFSVELIHRDSPKSPFYFPMETQYQRVANAVHRSINRANHFNRASTLANTPSSIVTPYPGEYLMSYSIGTPPFQLIGIVDTGSDITWMQCSPCKICYNQSSPMFDPSKSTTFQTIPCSSDTCHSVDSFCSSGKEKNCQYGIIYADNSYSSGDLSLETLTLNSTNGSPILFPKVVIGCGHTNALTLTGLTSGIVGLGAGPVSLISQMGSSIGGKFSYCLVPFTQVNSSSKLNFGYDDVIFGDGTVSTPMVPKHYYYLTMEAISVGDNRLEFGNSLGVGEEGNIIIDSGTTLTFLPYDVYFKLESTLANVVQLERVEDPTNRLNLCFSTTSGKLEVPVITAHFSGADVRLNAFNTFVQVDDDVVCLAFTHTQGIGLFGNLAQQNFLIGYDLQKNIVSFKPTDCTIQ